jgi:hypothetical protein
VYLCSAPQQGRPEGSVHRAWEPRILKIAAEDGRCVARAYIVLGAQVPAANASLYAGSWNTAFDPDGLAGESRRGRRCHSGSPRTALRRASLHYGREIRFVGWSMTAPPGPTGDVRLQNTVGLQNTLNNCAELYFSSHNNIARWLGVDHGRTAITVAKSNGPKINVRTSTTRK